MKNGQSNHRTLVKRGEQFIQKRENCSCVESSTEYNPDLCLEDTSLCESGEFKEVWFEAEVSTIRRPSNIINKITQAAESNAKIVFLVNAVEDKRIDYFAKRIDNIIGPPSLMSHYSGKNEYRLYKSMNELRTSSGSVVLIDGDNRYDWIYNDKKQVIKYGGDNSEIKIQNPSTNTTVKGSEVGLTGKMKEDCFVVTDSSDETQKYDSVKDSSYNIVKQPAYPFSVPRNRIEKVIDSVEYLIFGDNVTYHRVHPKLDSYIDGLD